MPNIVDMGKWHHIAAVHEDGDIKTYEDGKYAPPEQQQCTCQDYTGLKYCICEDE